MIDEQAEVAAKALVHAMAAFDENTAEHLKATADLTVRIADCLGLDEQTKRRARIGALLHDIGMLAIDRVILEQSAMLVDAEWAQMQSHSHEGEALITAIPALREVALIVRAHHERLDGSGYPDGLRNYEIPIESRIIAVADAFHTITMPHAYRQTFSTQAAMAELFGNVHSQFDEQVVKAFAGSIGYRVARLRLA